jgi:hypothetical protein
VNWRRRFDQQHAGHLLSALSAQVGAATVSFHLGAWPRRSTSTELSAGQISLVSTVNNVL